MLRRDSRARALTVSQKHSHSPDVADKHKTCHPVRPITSRDKRRTDGNSISTHEEHTPVVDPPRALRSHVRPCPPAGSCARAMPPGPRRRSPIPAASAVATDPALRREAPAAGVRSRRSPGRQRPPGWRPRRSDASERGRRWTGACATEAQALTLLQARSRAPARARLQQRRRRHGPRSPGRQARVDRGPRSAPAARSRQPPRVRRTRHAKRCPALAAARMPATATAQS